MEDGGVRWLATKCLRCQPCRLSRWRVSTIDGYRYPTTMNAPGRNKQLTMQRPGCQPFANALFNKPFSSSSNTLSHISILNPLLTIFLHSFFSHHLCIIFFSFPPPSSFLSPSLSLSVLYNFVVSYRFTTHQHHLHTLKHARTRQPNTPLHFFYPRHFF